MDHILLTKDDQQERGMRMSPDSFQGDPSDFLPTSARLAIDLADFSHFSPSPLALTSPGNTATSDGSEKDFGGQGLMSPDANSDFSFLTHDTLPSDATVPDLSVMISQILNSQSLLNNGYQNLTITQSLGIYQAGQDSLLGFNVARATNNVMLNATAATISDRSALFSQIHGPNSLFDNGSLLAPQTVDIHQDDFKDFLNFHQSNLNDDWMQSK
ncbi:hypothetical protein CAEBREN_26051 [Caenorhabditis brenneri]|uniref:Uncharacterized protein n=1 Tax=Caenorhabditis brenneri TaxID=135651 RepID=G0PDJ6_CAEBE|nr:hypothetical protein CAEBREN_26051 [Caenorhabditis brenneri]